MSTPQMPPRNERPAPGKPGMTPPRKPKKGFSNGLVALSSAAVIAVYAAGYARTESAAGEMAAIPAIPAATTAPTATAAAAPTNTPQPAPVAGKHTERQRSDEKQSDEKRQKVSSAPSAPNASAASSASAPSSAPSAPTAPTATATTTTTASTTAAFKDGTYMGTGTSRHGSIGVTVTVQGGKLTSAAITDCGTRYPCSRIAALPAQAVARQSAAVDLVSGATDSTNAYRAAVNAALVQAR